MFAAETLREIAAVASEFAVEPAALLAVAEVESGGRAYAMVEGRREPLIRFEGHYFDRRLAGASRDRARQAGLASPTAGKIANPAGQAARWRLLEQAAAIDSKAAYESVSWGLGQVMGAHWAWLGYASVDALVAEARSGAAGQTRLMARYIVKAGLRDALTARDWARFAHGYNGPNYRKNKYDTRIALAHRRNNSDIPPAPAGGTGDVLRRGMSGNAVRQLQLALSATGYPLRADGRFGTRTEAALRRFQQDSGLASDGMAGPRTFAALRETLSTAGRLRRWWKRIRALVASLLAQRSI
jgi:murein L,D-transpeptidase YcbB/YkuD